MTFEAIASELGYRGRSGAKMAVEAALHKTLIEPSEEMRVLHLERLNTILISYWPRMLRGDIKAAELIMRVLERISKLRGLDAPAKVDLRMIEDEARQLAAKLGLDADDLMDEARRIAVEAGLGF